MNPLNWLAILPITAKKENLVETPSVSPIYCFGANMARLMTLLTPIDSCSILDPHM